MLAFSLGVQLDCARTAHAIKLFVIVPKRQDWVVEPFGWQYPALDQALHFQHGVYIIIRLTRMHLWVTYGKFNVLANVRIQAHYITVLNGLTLTYLAVVAHGLVSTP
jgi:hypothetical protein